ncbi:MAG: shikimate kinase [Acidobacteria bacterium]|nr:shikimate kinase [Acidobacteriota bacterium]
MRVYLVGFMGAGKTTVGSVLAERMKVPFLDLDELVEGAEKMSIRDIFAEQGEPYFRKRESDILALTAHLESAVIATGGGTYTFRENVALIDRVGISVYLSLPYSILRERISRSSAERPMFTDEMALHRLFNSRIEHYRQASLAIEVREEETPREVADRILNRLRRSGEHNPGDFGESFL